MRRITRILPKSSFQIGILLIFVTAVAGWALFNKQRILKTNEDGTNVTIEFARQYRLKPFESTAKVAGVPVGQVTDVEFADGRAVVTVKIEDEDIAKLGTAPSAAVRPATLLGGTVYIDITPGGGKGEPTDRIPMERTTVPVELDTVLETLDANSLDGLRSLVVQSEGVMSNGGSEAFAGLIETAPDALPPTAEVLQGLTGVNEGDLARAIDGLSNVTRALAGNDDEFDRLLVALADVSTVLGSEAPALGEAIADLPVTTDNLRAAMAELDDLLAELDATAPELTPFAQELDQLLATLGPVARDGRPVVADLRAVVADLTPTLADLAPGTADARDIIDDLDGEIIQRIVGPTLDTLLAPYRDSDTMLYQEFGYMLSGLAGNTMGVDENGPFLNFSPGTGLESVAGLGIPGLATGGYDPARDQNPDPAPVVVDTSNPAPNVLTAPPSSVPDGSLARDGAHGTVNGDGSGGTVPGAPFVGDPLDGGAGDGDAADPELASSNAPSDHENSPWRVPLAAIIALASLIAWVLVWDTYRRQERQR